MGEKLYRCPRCKSGSRPRDEWTTRYGIMTCGICLCSGHVILPEEVEGEHTKKLVEAKVASDAA